MKMRFLVFCVPINFFLFSVMSAIFMLFGCNVSLSSSLYVIPVIHHVAYTTFLHMLLNRDPSEFVF
jgi:hypothetical protein